MSAQAAVTAWSDKQIASGSQWFAEIKAALAKTRVAVLLVSPGFLASDFIHEHELGPLLAEAQEGAVRILWVPILTCSYEETPLKDLQAVSHLRRNQSGRGERAATMHGFACARRSSARVNLGRR